MQPREQRLGKESRLGYNYDIRTPNHSNNDYRAYGNVDQGDDNDDSIFNHHYPCSYYYSAFHYDPGIYYGAYDNHLSAGRDDDKSVYDHHVFHYDPCNDYAGDDIHNGASDYYRRRDHYDKKARKVIIRLLF
jgi:hypothetical protein